MSGFILLHRSMVDWEWYTDSNTSRLFFHLLLKANWEDKMWQGMEIKRGQLFTSLDSLADGIVATKMQIRVALNKLKSTREVNTITTRKGLLVTICKYEHYQDIKNFGNTMITRKQHDGNTMITPTKELKEINNNTYSFEQFWDDYEKKTGLQKCLSLWKKLSDADKLKIKQHVPKYKKAQPDKKYRKNPQGYLNQRGWEDEIIEATGKPEIPEAPRLSLQEAEGLKNSFG